MKPSGETRQLRYTQTKEFIGMQIHKKCGVWATLAVTTVVFFAIIFFMLPRGPRDLMAYTDAIKIDKPLLRSKTFAVVTGTPWASQAAVDVLEEGGTACDAAVAALLMLNVTHGEAASFAGVAPTMVYDAATGRVRSYIGAGKAPQAATIEVFKNAGHEHVPTFDVLSQLIPSSPDVIAALLSDCGSMSFSRLSAPAIKLALDGFPVHTTLQRNLNLSLLERIGFSILMPSTAHNYLRGQWWRPIHLHDRMRLPELAGSLKSLARAEQLVLDAGGDRSAGIRAMRDYFYEGPIAEKILDLHQQEGGLFTRQDLKNYSGGWEEPIAGSYGDYTFYGNGTWSQGIMEPLVLQILESIDLGALEHNSTQYIHAVTQAIELAMADRDAYVADSDFVRVPLDVLLSKKYASARRSEMTHTAYAELPAPGKITGFDRALDAFSVQHSGNFKLSQLTKFSIGQDTSQLAVVDAEGNAVVITPSDFPKSPMPENTGINLGDRMTQFRLDPAHVNSLMPGKRPRITPHSVIVFKEGQFFMAYSTPGGDMQAQALVQVFLNMEIFGMDLQQAINAPRFYSISAPSSFSPHEFTPAGIRLEADLYAQAAQGLKSLGYDVSEDPKWDKDFGAVGAIIRNADGELLAGADPREETTAMGR